MVQLYYLDCDKSQRIRVSLDGIWCGVVTWFFFSAGPFHFHFHFHFVLSFFLAQYPYTSPRDVVSFCSIRLVPDGKRSYDCFRSCVIGPTPNRIADGPAKQFLSSKASFGGFCFIRLGVGSYYVGCCWSTASWESVKKFGIMRSVC